MERFRKTVTARLAMQQQTGLAHPDSEVLTAFAEASLSRSDRQSVLQHLTHCAACREVLALTTASIETHPFAALPSRTAGWGWRRTALFAVPALALGLVLLVRPHPRTHTLETTTPPAVGLRTATTAPPPLQTISRPKNGRARSSMTPHKPAIARKAPNPIPELGPPHWLATEVFAATGDAPVENRISPAVRWQPALSHLRDSRPAKPENSADFAMGVFSQQKNFTHPVTTLAVTSPPTLWAIGSSFPKGTEMGELLKSNDDGKTWQPVPLPSRVRLTALASSGRDVWAGAEDGTLYHSADGGGFWNSIYALSGKPIGSESITRLTIVDRNTLELHTRSGVWVTSDRGAHWAPR